jgi:hypothetical protein
VGRGTPDDEAAALEARYEARVAEIEAWYQEQLGKLPVGPELVARMRDERLREAEQAFLERAKIVEARQLFRASRAEKVVGGDRQRRAERAGKGKTGPPLTRPLPPLPPDLNLHLFSSIRKGARLFEAGASINRVHRETNFILQDARRLHWMLERELFRLDAGELLPPDRRVARAGRRYGFRFLDEVAWRWVDPIGTGSTPA